MLDKIEGFVSKKLAAGAAGIVCAEATGSVEVLWVAIAYIVSQAAVDCVKSWRNGQA